MRNVIEAKLVVCYSLLLGTYNNINWTSNSIEFCFFFSEIIMFWLLTFLLAAIGCVHTQLTAQTSIAPELRECYYDPLLLNRNNLPPTTIPVLIDIIRKVEDNPNINMDLRQLSTLLLHT